MNESHFDEIWEVFREHGDFNSSVYLDGINDGEYVLVVSDWEEAHQLNALLKEKLLPQFDDIERDYETFWLDYATGNNWHFSDEGWMCSECGKWYINNIGYAATPRWEGDGFVLCSECVKENPDGYIAERINNPDNANTILSPLELKELGFERVNEDTYANGWYGQEDDPRKIYDKAREQYPNAELLFSIKENYNPFEAEFDLYKRNVSD